MVRVQSLLWELPYAGNAVKKQLKTERKKERKRERGREGEREGGRKEGKRKRGELYISYMRPWQKRQAHTHPALFQ